MKRYYIVYSGIVQGVGFRWRLLNIAKRYGICGYCRNLDNGNVECEIQGDKESLDSFFKDSLNKDRFARVYDYSIKELPPSDSFHSFEVRF